MAGDCPVELRGLEEELEFLRYFLTTEKAVHLKDAYVAQLLGISSLSSSTFKDSNAADTVGWSFSDAYCSIEDNNDPIYIGSFFPDAMQMLGQYIRKKVLPSDRENVELLYLLTQYLANDGDQNVIRKFDQKYHNEAPFRTVLANHLLSKLALKKGFRIDEHTPGRDDRDDSCPCGCWQDVEFGDTSIGNPKVWHGSLDVVLESGLAVQFLDKEDLIPFFEVKKSKDVTKSVCQFVAQCIVFAFLQKNKYLVLKRFPIPSIGFCGRDFIVYMYDSENDVLLKSTVFQLLSKEKSYMNTSAILIIWLLVNYQSFSSELPGFYSTVPKANFFEIAKPKLKVYERQLEFGRVWPSNKRKLTDISCTRTLEDFQYPDEKHIKLKEEFV